MSNISDKIWITGRTRMGSEARLRRQATLWNLLIVWYTVALSCLSVYQLVAEPNSNRNVVSTIMAIIVMSLSIFIPTLGFERKADQFRACYLRLQRLSDTVNDPATLCVQYHEILENFPNHPTHDWIALLVSSKMQGTPIENNGTEIPVTNCMIIKRYIWNFSQGAVWFIAFLVPLGLYTWLIR